MATDLSRSDTKGFKKCCISNAMDGRMNKEEVGNAGSESDEVRNGDSEGGEVGNCEDSVTNW
jgi:hypothetical protein